jgi:hypothetical protein
MAQFKVGDRVRTTEEAKPNLASGMFTGTVVRVGKHISVMRDDGLKGGVSADGSWSTNPDWIELIPGEEPRPAGRDEETATAHVAGLSPERVDWKKVMHGRWEE